MSTDTRAQTQRQRVSGRLAWFLGLGSALLVAGVVLAGCNAGDDGPSEDAGADATLSLIHIYEPTRPY